MLAIFPEVSAAVKSGDIERLGILTRTYFCGDQATTPKFNGDALLRRYGIGVVRMNMEDFGRIAVRDERGAVQCSFAVRQGLSETEEAFLLAHLLGHFILHVQPKIAKSEWTASGYREEVLPSSRYTHTASSAGVTAQQFALEDQADRFAGAVLMPSSMLKRAKEKQLTNESIAKVFGVTQEMVERRLDDLNGRNLVGEVIEGAVTGARREPHRDVEPRAQESRRVGSKSHSPQEDTAHMVREQHHKDAPVPRAVAAQSYSSTSSGSQKTFDAQEDAKVLSGKGMERLREIARMLDKSGRS